MVAPAVVDGADGMGDVGGVDCSFAEALLARALVGMEACHGGSKFLELGGAEVQRIRQLLEEIPSARRAFLAILGPPPVAGNSQPSGGGARPAVTQQERAAAVALVGRFRALERGHADAMAQALFQQAVGIDSSCAMAHYGLARHRLETAGCRAEALALAEAGVEASGGAIPVAIKMADAAEVADATCCLQEAAACARLLAAEVAQGPHPGPGLEYDASQCIFLLDSAARRLLEGVDCEPDPAARPPIGFVWELLADLTPLASTAGALAWESLVRRFLLKSQGPAMVASEYLTGIDLESAPLPHFVREALAHSQVFGHPVLEPYISRWRAQLASRLGPCLQGALKGRAAEGGREADDLEDAAAVALYCHFVQYCIPLLDDEAEITFAQKAQAIFSDRPSLQVSERSAALAIVTMYGQLELHGAATWAEESAATSRGLVQELLRRAFLSPLADAAVAAQLPRVTAVGANAAQGSAGAGNVDSAANPCRDFYEEILYPPWHDGCEAIGRLPLPVSERLRRLFPDARRGSGTASVLIAGCGSGKQIVTELRSYADCPVVALDLAPQTVAYAQRRLRSFLAPSEFARVDFCVGDIQALEPNSFDGQVFDLVVCVGVLHHLPDPRDGLRRLATLLKPGTGILQLATYSTLGSGPMLATARNFLRQANATQSLFDESGDVLRQPTRAEVRALRREVFGLPADHPMRELCEEARDFATTAGVLDLFFHPLECTFSLAELGELLRSAGLESLGVLCHNPHQDRENRRRYADIEPLPPSGGTTCMADLSRWHAVEAAFPEAFGRMHTVFAQRPPVGAA